MCGNAPDHHASVTADLERVGRGRYRLPTADAGLLAAPPTAAPRAQAEGPPLSVASPLVGPAVAGEQDGTRGRGTAATVVAEPLQTLLPDDSSEQREVESVMLAALAADLGVALAPARVHLPDGSYADVDGLSEDPPVPAEVWAHQGPPKSAQRNKLLADALKLTHLASHLGRPHRKMLCLSDDETARPFLGRSWYAGALRAMSIEVLVVKLDERWRERIRAAQRRQYR